MGVLDSHEWSNLVFILWSKYLVQKKGKKAKYIQIKTQIIKITHSDLWSKGDGHKSSKFPYTEIILQTNLLLKQKGNKNTFFLWLQI